MKQTQTPILTNQQAPGDSVNQPLNLVGFLCNWCSYAGSDLAGTSRIHYDTTMRAIRVMCSGRVEPSFIIKAFQEGADGVIIAGCHIPADCHYTSGNFKALNRYETFLPLLDEMGIERERLQLHWISASEGDKFARVMNDFTETIRRLGPLDLERVRSRCPLRRCGLSADEQKTGAWEQQNGESCAVIRRAQEFVACEAASSGMVDLAERKSRTAVEQQMAPSIRYDANQCIHCGSCVETCSLLGLEALRMDPQKGVILDESRCVRCGQCVLSCPLAFPDKTLNAIKQLMDCQMCFLSSPSGAIREQDDIGRVLTALADPEQTVVVEVAPAVRSTIGEAFGAETGTVFTHKLYAGLRQAGFDRVWDTNFSADLTIMEEGTELIHRLKATAAQLPMQSSSDTGAALPQMTSCCPAWVRFVETNYPQLIPHLSTAKSPQQMLGAVVKTYGAEKLALDPAKLFVVSVMPCTAKKYERNRPEMTDAAHYWQKTNPRCEVGPDVDVVLTTRELVRLLKQRDIDLSAMPETEPDALFGSYSGAATLFGRTGGVMTAALRTAYEVLTGEELPDPAMQALGADTAIKTGSLTIGETEVKVAVAHGLQYARQICEDILAGGPFAQYHFIEIMTCPGGCVGGGGQIISTNRIKAASRAGGLNQDDNRSAVRKSHANPEIMAVYEHFLQEPCSDLSHHLLHTQYKEEQNR